MHISAHKKNLLHDNSKLLEREIAFWWKFIRGNTKQEDCVLVILQILQAIRTSDREPYGYKASVISHPSWRKSQVHQWVVVNLFPRVNQAHPISFQLNRWNALIPFRNQRFFVEVKMEKKNVFKIIKNITIFRRNKEDKQKLLRANKFLCKQLCANTFIST